jgi:phosphonate metabolism protein PhnN/1,5-bisphosphokinase (PRPP-forming)
MGGRLIAVVGPSGAGKDRLIAAARERLAGDGRIVFPRRVITRPVVPGDENHIAMSPDDFAAAEAAGRFALSWQAHGAAYGIEADIAGLLRAGHRVVINLSRGLIGETRRRFAPLRVVYVHAPPAILAARLTARGRETPEQIARRLARASLAPPVGEDVITIENSGSLEPALESFMKALR